MYRRLYLMLEKTIVHDAIVAIELYFWSAT